MRRALIGPCLALAVIVAGCGSSNSSSSSGGSTGKAEQPKAGGATQTSAPKNAKSGGTMTMLSNGDIDWADPGQTYYQFGFQIQYAVNRTLYSFKPADSEKPVPDLATADPEISADQKTLTIKIRPGVKYAPPVNREVKAQDVKYAIERAFTSNVPSGYATSYFSAIEGAPSAPVKISALKPFAGLQTPDDHTLVIKLTKPIAGLVTGALVMPITVPVPEEYAHKFDLKSPTDYDQYVAFTGPYMIKNDPKTGKLVGRDPGKKIEMVRNPNWDKATDYRPAYLNSIVIDEGNNEPVISSRRTIAGKNLTCCGDASKPPPSILARVLTHNRNLVGRASGGGAHWDSFNTRIKPLDNVNVRRAIIAIEDRFAIRKTAGGAATGPIAQGYIPPGIPGFDESGGVNGFKEFDFMQHPDGGSPQVAAKYMALAAKDGVPIKNGKYVGKAQLEGVVASVPDSVRGAEVAAAGMAKLGFDLKIKQVPQDTLYTKFCGVPKVEPAMCIGIGWVKDFQDAQTLISPIFPSNTIKPAGNVNYSLLRDPAVDKTIAAAELKPAGPERNKAFAEANRQLVGVAPTLLTTWDDNIQIESPNVAGVMNAYNASWDLSYTSIR